MWPWPRGLFSAPQKPFPGSAQQLRIWRFANWKRLNSRQPDICFFAFIELGNKWKLDFFPLRPNNPPSKKRRDTEKCILNSVSKGETQIICQAGTKRIHPPWKFNTPPLRSYHSQKGRNIWSSKHHFSGATLLNFRLYFSWGNLTWGG